MVVDGTGVYNSEKESWVYCQVSENVTVRSNTINRWVAASLFVLSTQNRPVQK